MRAFTVKPSVYCGTIKDFGFVSWGTHTLTHLGVKTVQAIPGDWVQYCTLGTEPITQIYHKDYPIPDNVGYNAEVFIKTDTYENWIDTVDFRPGWVEWERPGGLMVFSHTIEGTALRQSLDNYNSNYHPFNSSRIPPYPQSLVITVEKTGYYRYKKLTKDGKLSGLVFYRLPILKEDGKILERDDSMMLAV